MCLVYPYTLGQCFPFSLLHSFSWVFGLIIDLVLLQYSIINKHELLKRGLNDAVDWFHGLKLTYCVCKLKGFKNSKVIQNNPWICDFALTFLYHSVVSLSSMEVVQFNHEFIFEIEPLLSLSPLISLKRHANNLIQNNIEIEYLINNVDCIMLTSDW